MIDFRKDVDKKFKIFLLIVGTLIFMTGFLSYYRYMILKDFTTRLDESVEETEINETVEQSQEQDNVELSNPGEPK